MVCRYFTKRKTTGKSSVCNAHLVQPVLDAQARREISRFAAESTLMIAVSPLALVDMAFIAWRNLRLINRIATLYGD
ncbi:hypothetical protein SEEA0322_23354 [Salmonella enterica subsp. enterica serovar Agona str. 0322]|nr:hypothetical protein SEEA0322_23354 [Salmonella enterica subsp. enterica serovar Agona str. 0322]